MICVSIGRTRHKHIIAEHARLAELGAKLVELRVDYIGRSIDFGRLLNNRPTPVVVTCRRKEDGGRWAKSEGERQKVLRTAIVSGAEYVDLEEDIAGSIPRYGKLLQTSKKSLLVSPLKMLTSSRSPRWQPLSLTPFECCV
jgi:3-dehydroquinate dehydratase/shikimate dehydrogenase